LIYSGVILATFGFWWHINNCLHYVRSVPNENDKKSQQQLIKFEGSTSYTCFFIPYKVCRQWPIESIVKIIIAVIDVSMRIHDGYVNGPKPYIDPFRAMHIPMVFGFFLAGWVEILVHYKLIYPKRITQVMMVLAFAMETLTMVFHTHERDLLETHMHRLIAMTMICSMIVAIGECFYPNNFGLILGRSFFMLTQGTWFIQSAFILWPLTAHPYYTWDRNSHDSLSYATMWFGFHLAGNVLMLLILFLKIQKFVLNSRKLYPEEAADDHHIDRYKLIDNENDEDSQV
jgi:hypothetical protein